MTTMSSRIRVTPPPLFIDPSPADSLWFWNPKAAAAAAVDSPPALLWSEHIGEVVQAHETPMGACLLSPRTWAHSLKPEPPSPIPQIQHKHDTILDDLKLKIQPKKEPLDHIELKPLVGNNTRARTKKKPPKPPLAQNFCRALVVKTEMVERWTLKRYKEAEVMLVDVMHRMGALPESPVRRSVLKDELRKFVGDTGLLDHLLKHLVGRVVEGGERLRRLHNWEGIMEFWLEPADLCEIRRVAGVTDPYWVPPDGWKVGDSVTLCVKEEVERLREEVAALKRDYELLLQWKSMVDGDMEEAVVQRNELSIVEGEMEEEVVQGRELMVVKEEMEEEVVQRHELMIVKEEIDEDIVQECQRRPGGIFLSPLSAGLTGWGVRQKVKYTRRPREVPLLLETRVEGIPNKPTLKKKCKTYQRKAGHSQRGKKRKCEEMDRPTMIRRCRRNSRPDRWSPSRYEAAVRKLVELMHTLKVGLQSPISRLRLRDEMRKHIGDTGLLDHLLKHLAGKVVADGTERFQRRYTASGFMEYWLEPRELADIRQKAGVRDPCWIPPIGWKLGDTTSPCQCGAKCRNEMTLLREEVASLKRQVEMLNSQSLLEKDAEECLLGAGGLPELAELEDQGGKRYDWYVQLLEGSEGSYLDYESL